MSRYSLSTSTSSVGFTGTPLRARQRPPAFWAFLSVETMRVGWSGSMACDVGYIECYRFVKNGAKLRKNN